MGELTYTIYGVVGLDAGGVRMLVHIAEEPDNAYTFSSALVRKDERGLALERMFDERPVTWVNSLWQSSSGSIYAVSFAGNIHAMVRGSWDTTSLGKGVHLNDIWGLNDDRVYCCGMDGVLLTRAAGSWNRAGGGLQGDLVRLGGSAEDDLYVVGKRGAIFHFDGSRWAAIDSPTKQDFLYLLCVSKDVAYFCGRSGTLFRMTRNRWERVSGCGESTLYSLAQFRDRIFVGAAHEGILEVRGAEAIPFRKDVVAYGLRVIGDRLLAFGDTQINQFDGQHWSQESFNFGSLIRGPGFAPSGEIG